MGKFLNGIIIGAGAALLFAPMKGDEMRQMAAERFKSIQNSLSHNGHSTEIQRVSDQVTQTGNALKNSASQTATQAQSTASDLADKARQAGSDMKQTGQNSFDTTRQTGSGGIDASKQTGPSPRRDLK